MRRPTERTSDFSQFSPSPRFNVARGKILHQQLRMPEERERRQGEVQGGGEEAGSARHAVLAHFLPARGYL